MQIKPFEGSKLKIARSRRHIDNLKSEIARYLRNDPGGLLLVLDNDTKKHWVTFRMRDKFPPDLSLIFGDAIHNLRVALDILANDIVVLSGTQPRKVYFPFAEDSSGLEDQIKSKLKGASSDAIDMIRALKPYRGGNDALRALHDLDITDKHFAIITLGIGGTTPPLPMRQVGYERISGDRPNRVTIEADFGRLPVIPIDTSGFAGMGNARIVGKIAGSEVIPALGDGTALARRPVIETLDQLCNMTQGIVQSFETHFVGSGPPSI